MRTKNIFCRFNFDCLTTVTAGTWGMKTHNSALTVFFKLFFLFWPLLLPYGIANSKWLVINLTLRSLKLSNLCSKDWGVWFPVGCFRFLAPQAKFSFLWVANAGERGVARPSCSGLLPESELRGEGRWESGYCHNGIKKNQIVAWTEVVILFLTLPVSEATV